MPLVQRGEIYVVHYIPHMPLLIRSKQQLELGGKQPHRHTRFNPTSAYKHPRKLTASKNHHEWMTARLPWMINITYSSQNNGEISFLPQLPHCWENYVFSLYKRKSSHRIQNLKVDNCNSCFLFLLYLFFGSLALLKHSSLIYNKVTILGI